MRLLARSAATLLAAAIAVAPALPAQDPARPATPPTSARGLTTTELHGEATAASGSGASGSGASGSGASGHGSPSNRHGEGTPPGPVNPQPGSEPVPEPSTLLLVGSGLVGVALTARFSQRRKNQKPS